MIRRLLFLCVGVVTLILPHAAVAEDIAELLRRLEVGPKAARIEAMRKLREIKGPEALQALPGLTCLLEDKDAEIRAEAVAALATIVYLRKRPCPVGVVKALFDADAEVRETACTYAGVFEKYPDEARALLLRALEHEEVNVRACVSGPLASAWGKDKEVLAALKKAAKDKSLLVRNNAHAALWPVIQDLDFILPHWLQATTGLSDGRPEVKLDTEEAKRNQATATLIGLSAAMKLVELTAERPADLAKALVKLLADESPVIRRAAARVLGAMAVEPKEIIPLAKDDSLWKPPPVDREKVRAILKDLKVEAAVRKLLKDPDEGVRASAGLALERLTRN